MACLIICNADDKNNDATIPATNKSGQPVDDAQTPNAAKITATLPIALLREHSHTDRTFASPSLYLTRIITLSGIKVSTIRYYEQVGLISTRSRTEGNQHRYGESELERLIFIKHARELGFPIEAINALLELSEQPDESCGIANQIAVSQLEHVRIKMARLIKLESELARIANGCDGGGTSEQCYVLTSLSDHSLCAGEHSS